MRDEFTEDGEGALNAALRVAEELGHTYIGTEHLLLALLQNAACCAASILTKCGVEASAVRKKLCQLSGTGDKTHLFASDMTPRLKKAIEGAHKCTVKYGHAKIGTEHLLFALLDQKDCAATRLLNAMTYDTVRIKDEVQTLLRATERLTDRAANHKGLQFLNQYGKNLNSLAAAGKIDPVIGRDRETDQLIRILSRKTKNNPCLVGDAGVGKTAIVEGLARRISEGNVPPALKNTVIYSVDLTAMISGAKYRGDFEERIKSIIAEAAKNSYVILFIDEIHTIVGAGAAEGAIDAANILKPELARSSIRLIGATTYREYRRYIEKDPALERRFRPLAVEEPDRECTRNILMGIKPFYERHHGVMITDGAIDAAIDLSVRYLQARRLPDKAIDVLDEACAGVSMRDVKKQSKNLNTDVILEQNASQITSARIKSEPYYSPYRLENERKESLFCASDEHCHSLSEAPEVTVHEIKKAVSEISGIPISGIGAHPSRDEIYERLCDKIVGQPDACMAVANAVARASVGLGAPQRPMGSFLFYGSSGVGKTEVCKVLASLIFPGNDSLIRLDTSELSEDHAVSKLIGAPPGYTGYDEGGALTDKVKNRPFCLILFDEIEKASVKVRNLLLQILDEGELTDSHGMRVSFKNTYVVMTSNVGYNDISRGKTGFIGAGASARGTKSRELSEAFSEELLNRIDCIAHFPPLSEHSLIRIAKIHLDELISRVAALGIALKIGDGVADIIALRSADDARGARKIRHSIISLIENPISAELSERISYPSRISVTKDGAEIKISYEYEKATV